MQSFPGSHRSGHAESTASAPVQHARTRRCGHEELPRVGKKKEPESVSISRFLRAMPHRSGARFAKGVGVADSPSSLTEAGLKRCTRHRRVRRCSRRPHRSGGGRVYRAVRIDLNLATEAVGRRAHRGAASSRVTTEAMSKNGATVRASLRIGAETTTHQEVRGVRHPEMLGCRSNQASKMERVAPFLRACCATTEAAAAIHRKVRARVGKERHKRRRLSRPAPRGGKPFETPFRPDGTPRWDTGKPATFRDAPYRTRPQSA